MRNVRPSYVNVYSEGRASEVGTGPRARSGYLRAEFSARADGDAIPFLTVLASALSDGSAVVWTVTDSRTGREIFRETVAQ